MAKKYILALDQGTTSSRAILFDAKAQIVATAQQEFEQIFPKPGWVEHDANDIFKSVYDTAMDVMKKNSIPAEEIDSIGITNQRETTIVWNKKTGFPVYNAIVWQDRRTSGTVDALKAAGHEELFMKKTGLVLDAYFSGTKVKWILDHVEGARQLAEQGELLFGTVDTWLIWNLTRGRSHVTDVSNACRTLMYNIQTGDWDDELLDILEIPRAMLPEVRPSSSEFGEASSGLFGSRIQIASAVGDQQSATFGNLCLQPGTVKNTYGTGCFLMLNAGKEVVYSKNNLLSTVGWLRDGHKTTYCLEGSVFMGGALVQWLRDGLKIIDSAPEIEALALTEKDNGGVYFIPAFAGLGAPYWDSYARGSMFGLTRGVTRGHIARAALEAIALQVYDVFSAMQSDVDFKINLLRVDGGASKNDTLMQLQSDLLGIRIERPENIETTALGATFMAGLKTGFFESADQIAEFSATDKVFEPRMAAAQREDILGNWKRAIERSRNWIQP